MSDPTTVTQLLQVLDEGDTSAFNRLYNLIYSELKGIAAFQRARWDGDFTLNTTAIVHETYEKLVKASNKNWKNRKHFYGVAAKAMRQVLYTYAEGKKAEKRGGNAQKLSLEDASLDGAFEISEGRLLEIFAMENAMKKLEEISPREAKIVEYRFYLGLNVEETAEMLDIGTATVKRGWVMAKAWLYNELGGASE